jgi:hypothetical protein
LVGIINLTQNDDATEDGQPRSERLIDDEFNQIMRRWREEES